MTGYINNQVVETLLSANALQTGLTATTNGAATLTLVASSTHVQYFSGATRGQVLKLPDAQTLVNGHEFVAINESPVTLALQDGSGAALDTLEPYQRCFARLKDNGTTAGVWALVASDLNAFDPGSFAFVFDDFISSFNAGSLGWTATTAGAGSGAALGTPVNANNFGVLTLSTGTANTGRAGINTNATAIFFGGGLVVWQAAVRIPTASTSLQRFKTYAGFGDTTAAGDQTDGVYFTCVDNEQSGNWALNTAAAGVRTQASSGVAVAAGYTVLRIEVNAAGTRADFYINGTNVGNITTNIPAVVANLTGHLFKMEKSVGGTARTMDIDYMWQRFYPTTAR